MSEQREDPVKISDDLLEKSGAAIMAADFDAFRPHFAVPQKLETFDGQRWIDSPEVLEEVFRDIVTYMRTTGVTDLIRHCVEASYKGPATIVTTYETRMLRGTELIQRPFPGFSVLRFSSDGWQVSGCVVAIADAPEYSRALIGKAAGNDKPLRPEA
ncbi:hypothetical protein [Roseobacter ponti]|uniref:SnoaL-like domain-containing protein n=1 Tax=Roseobacter ponti TaxID=1891787 RepID=A0A858SQC0_9RHOB|nr:hypothetical protein [Roseobacter ponti]QJF50197.1 hypothetical protein G3256_02950 [Roseobacter ponti]